MANSRFVVGVQALACPLDREHRYLAGMFHLTTCRQDAGAPGSTLDFGLRALDFNLGAMSQMLKSSGAMAAATLTSRLLGMVREMVYARFMGDGWVAGAFQFAFTIPNLFRRLLGEGALTAAFIPSSRKRKKRTAKWRCGAPPTR
jgi:hypothetical protein